MKKYLIFVVMCIAMVACKSEIKKGNPFFYEWETPFGVPPLDKFRVEHFLPAFKEAMNRHRAEIDSITSCADAPTFDNTILAYDRAGEMLRTVENVFYPLCDADTNEKLEKVKARVSPLLSAHGDAIAMDSVLFTRVKSVYDRREELKLDEAQTRLTELAYRGFVRGGALLSAADKAELKAINEQLSSLEVSFGANRLAALNDYKLIMDPIEARGVPQNVISRARTLGQAEHLEDKLVFTLSKTSWIPLLTYLDNEGLRRQIYEAYLGQCAAGTKFDNTKIINEMISLRTRKAHLMGFETYADFVLDDRMAKTPERAYKFLDSIWTPALAKATQERDRMRNLKRSELGDSTATLNSWDWWFYAEKVRRNDYNLDEENLRNYFSLENVRDGIFKLCNRLYGITFRPVALPVYHKDVMTYEVLDMDNSHLGVIYMDFFPRPGKGAGAWCGTYRTQGYSRKGDKIHAATYIVCNFTEPVEGTSKTPSLLTLDEVGTFFHEFGHAIHNLFSDVPYRGLEHIQNDFVELPSQIMENWAFRPELLGQYAVHHRTGAAISKDMINRITRSAHFNQGFETTEQLAASLSDLDIHSIKEYEPLDVAQFEKNALTTRRGLISEIEPRYHYPYFSHIFNGGYQVGYYGYIWAEVLDKDAFEAFVESGDVFNRRIADDFRHKVLARQGLKDGDELYRDFRGTEPSPLALFKARGLIEIPEPYVEPPMNEAPADSVLRMILGEGPLDQPEL